MICTTQPSNLNQLYFNLTSHLSTILNVPNKHTKLNILFWNEGWLPTDLLIQCLYSWHHPAAVPPTLLQWLLLFSVCMDNSLKMIPILWTKKKVLNPSASSFFFLYQERTDKGVFDWQTTSDTDDGTAEKRIVGKTVIIQMPLLPLNKRD